MREKLRQLQAPREKPNINPICQPGDQVRLKSYYKERGKGAKLQPKIIGPYRVLRALPYQVHEVELEGGILCSLGRRIKMYYAGEEPRRCTDKKNPLRIQEATADLKPVSKIEEPSVPEPDLPEGLPLLELSRAVQELEEEMRDSDRELEVPAEFMAAESETEDPKRAENDLDSRDEPAAVKKAVNVIDVPRPKLPPEIGGHHSG